MNLTAPLSLTDRLALTLEGLYRAVAARSAKGIFGQVMATWMILMVCRRVRHAEGKIVAMLARFRAGTLRARPVASQDGPSGERARASSTPPRSPTAKLPRDPTAKLPRSFGWLMPMVPYEAACFASQLRCLLAEPEMMALLAASPQARRVLAPMCRMLAIEASVLMPADPVGGAVDVNEAVGDVAAPLEPGWPDVAPSQPMGSEWWGGRLAGAPSG